MRELTELSRDFFGGDGTPIRFATHRLPHPQRQPNRTANSSSRLDASQRHPTLSDKYQIDNIASIADWSFLPDNTSSREQTVLSRQAQRQIPPPHHSQLQNEHCTPALNPTRSAFALWAIFADDISPTGQVFLVSKPPQQKPLTLDILTRSFLQAGLGLSLCW